MNTLTDKERPIAVENTVVVPQAGRLGFVINSALDNVDASVQLSQQAGQDRLDLMAEYDEKCEPVRAFITDTINSAIEGIDPAAIQVSNTKHRIMYAKKGWYDGYGVEYPKELVPPSLQFNRFVNVETDDGVSTLQLRFTITGNADTDMASQYDELANKESMLGWKLEELEYLNRKKPSSMKKKRDQKKEISEKTRLLLKLDGEIAKTKTTLRTDTIPYVLANPTQLSIEIAVLGVEQPATDVTTYQKVTLPWSGEIMYAKPIEGASLAVSMPDSAETAFAKSIELDKPWEELSTDEAAEAVKKAALAFEDEKNAPQMNQAEIDEYTSLIMQSYA